MMTLLTLSTLFFGNIPNEAASLNPPAGEQQVVAAEPQSALPSNNRLLFL